MGQVGFRRGWTDFWHFWGSVCRLFEEWGLEEQAPRGEAEREAEEVGASSPHDDEEAVLRVPVAMRDGDGDGAEADDEAAVLCFGDLVLDTRTREVRRGVRTIDLTPTEFRLLELLLRNPRQVLTRAVIYDRVWGFDFGPRSNTLSVYVGYVRRKLEAEGEPRLIHTIRGVGYMLHK